jgi:hypothetical protein
MTKGGMMKEFLMTRLRVSRVPMIALAAVVALAPLMGTAPVSQAASRTAPNASGVVTINGGGGLEADGSDGIALVFNMNSTDGSFGDAGDDIIYKGSNYTFGPGDIGVHLNIGGQLYSTMNGSTASECLLEPFTTGTCDDTTSADTLAFDDLAITLNSGSARSDGSMTATGAGKATLTYTVDVGGDIYTLKRIITYLAGG